MPEGPETSVTHLLGRIRSGDEDASSELLPIVYAELRRLATVVFSDQNPDHTLQPTALVHEAWLKLAPNLDGLNDRCHFFIVAAKAMRQVLTDHARGKLAGKRGGGARRVTLDSAISPVMASGVDLLALHEALEKLASLNERHARVVELRLLGALTIDETANAIGVSHGTVESDWAMAKAWLRTELAPA